MSKRSELQTFLALSAVALSTATRGNAARAAERVGALLRADCGQPIEQATERLAVCDWVDPALALAAAGPRADLAAAFAALSGQLSWKRRQTSDPADLVFWNGHANAMILGPGGLEERADVWVGVTVMAPRVTYPPHTHPPEEIYLGLAPGEWWNAEMDWTDPGLNGAIYNPPGILHAMRAGGAPFLALWYLPI